MWLDHVRSIFWCDVTDSRVRNQIQAGLIESSTPSGMFLTCDHRLWEATVVEKKVRGLVVRPSKV